MSAMQTLAAANGWPLADYECKHGHLAHDRVIPCNCFDQKEEPMDAAKVCKVDGCENFADKQFGPYGGLCLEHRPVPMSESLATFTPNGLVAAASAIEEQLQVLEQHRTELGRRIAYLTTLLEDANR